MCVMRMDGFISIANTQIISHQARPNDRYSSHFIRFIAIKFKLFNYVSGFYCLCKEYLAAYEWIDKSGLCVNSHKN